MNRLLPLLFCGVLYSCWPTDFQEDVVEGELTFHITFPDTFKVANAPNVDVSLIASNGFVRQALTDAEGRVTFSNLLPGIYSLGAQLQLDDPDVIRSIADTDLLRINFNAAVNGIELLNGLPASYDITLSPSIPGDWVFEEIYYSGCRTPNDQFYFSDQFFQITNNSNEVLYADGLLIGHAYGTPGRFSATTAPSPFQDDLDHVYLDATWRVPGSGTDFPVQPGESFVIAQDPIDHPNDPVGNPNSPVDLTGADWEFYMERDDGRDIDVPTTPNMERLYVASLTFDYLVTVFGPGMVLYRTDDFDGLERVLPPDRDPDAALRIKVPNELVIDAVEAVRTIDDGDFKRIPVALDAGFISLNETYICKSIVRKTELVVDGRSVLKDTNNTTLDFEVSDLPDPN